LRQSRLSPKDLDPIGRGYLDLYCRLAAKLDSIDRHIDEHGLMKDDGEPQPIRMSAAGTNTRAAIQAQVSGK